MTIRIRSYREHHGSVRVASGHEGKPVGIVDGTLEITMDVAGLDRLREVLRREFGYHGDALKPQSPMLESGIKALPAPTKRAPLGRATASRSLPAHDAPIDAEFVDE